MDIISSLLTVRPQKYERFVNSLISSIIWDPLLLKIYRTHFCIIISIFFGLYSKSRFETGENELLFLFVWNVILIILVPILVPTYLDPVLISISQCKISEGSHLIRHHRNIV